MELFELVKKNEELILSFNQLTLNHNRNAIMAALNALDINNELQEYYIKSGEEEFAQGELILRLYGILQGLFVSIDSLYALAYGLTNSKSFININQNRELRELKYIRNDVVGHPSNRVLHGQEVAYCLLNKEDITSRNFKYQIISKNKKKVKEVDMNVILLNYYKESNELLKTMFHLMNKKRESNNIVLLAKKLYHTFYDGGDYLTILKELKKEYKQEFSVASKNRHRLLWRIDLVERLLKISIENVDMQELIDYAVAFEIGKIFETSLSVNQEEGIIDLEIKKKLPRYLRSFYRMINHNTELVEYTSVLNDMTHPLFKTALERCRIVAENSTNNLALALIKVLEACVKKRDSDMVYAIGILIKRYKKK